MARFDQIDKKIISLLNQNARLSSADISRRLGISERTVRNRINRLIDKKVIWPRAIVKPSAFGFTLAVDIFCELELGKQDEVIAVVSQMEEVSYLAFSTGEQDISIQAVFHNSDEMHHFITNKLHKISGIKRTRTVLVPRIVKETYEWIPPDDLFASGNKPGDEK